MQSIVYQDKASGSMYMFNPAYPKQRSMLELTRTERIANALSELQPVTTINIFLYKHNKLRMLSTHPL